MKRYRTPLLLVCLAVAAGVSTSGSAGPTATAPEPMSELACLRKMSLDLAHRGPTAAEIADIKAKRISLAQAADAYLASPEFSQVVFDWYRREFPPTSITPDGVDTEEPARIARHVIVNDQDLRELLTGTYTVGKDGKVAAQVGHPAAGVLSTKHYMTSALGLLRRNWAGRFQRQWTGITLKAVSIADGDPVDVTRDGLAANPECAGCHVHPIYGIDFLARHVDCWKEDGSYDSACVEPEAHFLTVAAKGLVALGQTTVASKEWKAQMVNMFFRQLFGRALAISEAGYYLDAVKAFEDSGFRAKALIKHLVTTPAYCAR